MAALPPVAQTDPDPNFTLSSTLWCHTFNSHPVHHNPFFATRLYLAALVLEKYAHRSHPASCLGDTIYAHPDFVAWALNWLLN